MFGKSIQLFKVFGFSVKIDASWLVILVLVVWSLASGVFPTLYEGFAPGTYWIMGFLAAIGLFLSIVIHELCHSLVARIYGLPMKGITLFMFGGVAEMSDEPPSPKAEFMMAAAGPASSLVLVMVFYSVSVLGSVMNWPTTVTGVFSWISLINLILVIFNLIPGFPLDGGRILRSILWHFRHDLKKATRTASQVGLAFGAVLIALGVLNLLLIRDPIGGLWWILIGFFIRSAAGQSYQQVVVRQALQGERVRSFMNTQPITVNSRLSIEELVGDFIYKHHFKLFPVVDEGNLAGCVSTKQVQGVPREQWHDKKVSDVIEPCSLQNTIGPDEDAMTALTMMYRTGQSRLLVIDDGKLLGILSLRDLLQLLSLKLELEGDTRTRKKLEQRLAQDQDL